MAGNAWPTGRRWISNWWNFKTVICIANRIFLLKAHVRTGLWNLEEDELRMGNLNSWRIIWFGRISRRLDLDKEGKEEKRRVCRHRLIVFPPHNYGIFIIQLMLNLAIHSHRASCCAPWSFFDCKSISWWLIAIQIRLICVVIYLWFIDLHSFRGVCLNYILFKWEESPIRIHTAIVCEHLEDRVLMRLPE